MTDTFRDLCAELIAEMDQKAWGITSLPSSDAIDRARTALAEGAGVGPADEELETLVIAIQALVPIVDDGTHLLEAVDKGRDILRRAMHNYGTTHPRSIPVAERPWEREGFCDAEGRCWFGWPESYGNDEGGAAGWMLMHPDHRSPGDPYACPAAAIPLP
jgi:hypothetical protein